MTRLDCENLDSTIASLSYAFEISESDIRNILLELEVDEGYGACEDLFQQFTTDRCYRSFEDICFFHATRVSKGTRFDEGVLPLKEIIEKFSNFLYCLVSDSISRTEWDACVCDTVNSNSSNLSWKINNQNGPFGFLFRESALNEGSYLKGPDLVFDLSRFTKDRFNLDLMKLYGEQTEPVIVKFSCPVHNDRRYLECALFNTFIKINELDCPIQHCAIDCGGVAVPRNSILEIEFVNGLSS